MWQRMVHRWNEFSRAEATRPEHYLFAVITSVVVSLLLLSLRKGLPLPVGMAVTLPVIVSAYAGGLGPGLVTVFCLLPVSNFILSNIVNLFGVPATTLWYVGWSVWFFVGSALVCVAFEFMHRARRLAQRQQQWHLSTLAHVDDVVVVTDAGGVVEYINASGCKLLGVRAEQVLGKLFDASLDIRDDLTNEKSTALATRDLGSHTLHGRANQVLVRADGRRVPIEATVAPVRNGQSQLTSVVYTLRDRTVQRNAERALQERLMLQSRLEHITRAVPSAIQELCMLSDGRRKLTYASAGFARIYGVEPARFVEDAKLIGELLHPDDIPLLDAALAAAMRGLAPVDVTHRLVTPHRGLVWVALSMQPIRNDDGSVVLHGVATDVTARKQAEERLYASQVQLRAALDAGGMGLLRMNLESGSLELDGVARTICGLPTEADTGITVEQLFARIHQDDRATAYADYLHMSHGPRAYHRRFRLAAAGQQMQWIECRGRIFHDESLGALVMMGVLADVTEVYHNAERNLHSQKLEALGVLAGGIAHDFNNLLQAISGNALLLLSELPESHLQRDTVREIDKACVRAADLVQRILTFSRPGGAERHRVAMRLNEVLRESVSLIRAGAPPGIKILCNLQEGLPAIKADEGQVHQALINLLGNALDAVSMDRGVIQCTTRQVWLDARQCLDLPGLHPGGYQCVTVADNGPGIATEHLSRIFDPFYTTKAKGRGTGLGLAIVHGVMKSHAGAVSVARAAEGGASMTLYFPANQVSDARTQTLRALETVSVQARILYVDDEEPLVMLMTRLLQRAGHHVIGCVTPEAALDAFRAAPDGFDLIVTDMAMPSMSGLELVRQIQLMRSDMPIVITTGFVDDRDTETAHHLGVRRVILKPNTIQELGAVINELAAELRQGFPVATMPQA